jgi:hypothetical protein
MLYMILSFSLVMESFLKNRISIFYSCFIYTFTYTLIYYWRRPTPKGGGGEMDFHVTGEFKTSHG